MAHVVKTNRWCTENHLGWALLSPWSNKSTAATALTNGAWHFPSKYNCRRGKSLRKSYNRGTNDTHPQPNSCWMYGGKREVIPWGKHGSGPAGQGPKCPFIAHHNITRGTQAYRLLSALCEPEHTQAESRRVSDHLPFQTWAGKMNELSIQFYFLWEVFSIRTSVFRRKFLCHASTTNDKSHLIIFQEIRCTMVVCELLPKEHLR